MDRSLNTETYALLEEVTIRACEDGIAMSHRPKYSSTMGHGTYHKSDARASAFSEL